MLMMMMIVAIMIIIKIIIIIIVIIIIIIIKTKIMTMMMLQHFERGGTGTVSLRSVRPTPYVHFTLPSRSTRHFSLGNTLADSAKRKGGAEACGAVPAVLAQGAAD